MREESLGLLAHRISSDPFAASGQRFGSAYAGTLFNCFLVSVKENCGVLHMPCGLALQGGKQKVASPFLSQELTPSYFHLPMFKERVS